jgi:hypothetical protein
MATLLTTAPRPESAPTGAAPASVATRPRRATRRRRATEPATQLVAASWNLALALRPLRKLYQRPLFFRLRPASFRRLFSPHLGVREQTLGENCHYSTIERIWRRYAFSKFALSL